MTWLVHKKNPKDIDKKFRNLQLVSAALNSLGHGGNDAQKTMGIITGLLIAASTTHPDLLKIPKFLLPSTNTPEIHVPTWVMIAATGAIALGTLSGGWRIVATMGQKITKLRPIDSFCADIASSASIFFATHFGIPVSTTHVITGAISGVGSAKRLSAVRWGVTLRIVWAWVLTIPLSGLFAYLMYLLLKILIK
jgi:PiT family inorganic phosphate transporter